MSPPKRIAMCGLGRWGPNLLRNLRENPGAAVTVLCDADPNRLKEFGELHPEAVLVTDFREAVSRDDVDAVVIATPAGKHVEHVDFCLETEKDVLVEKPLAFSLEDGRRLVAKARSKGRVLMVGHTFLFNPAVRRVKAEIANGSLGDLQLILAQRLSLGQIRSDCNALWNLAPHDVSILLYWLGAMPESVVARGMAFYEGHQQEDVALCLLEFPGRIVASVQVSWLNPIKVREMTVVGSRRMLRYDDVNQAAPLTLYNQGVDQVPIDDPFGSLESFRLQIRRGEEKNLGVPREEPLANEVQHWLECLETRGLPSGSGVEALRVLSVLEACDLSMKSGGKAIVPEEISS